MNEREIFINNKKRKTVVYLRNFLKCRALAFYWSPFLLPSRFSSVAQMKRPSETWISYIFHVSQNYYSSFDFPPFENIKQNQVVGQSWPVGHSLLTSALVNLLSWLLHKQNKHREKPNRLKRRQSTFKYDETKKAPGLFFQLFHLYHPHTFFYDEDFRFTFTRWFYFL